MYYVNKNFYFGCNYSFDSTKKTCFVTINFNITIRVLHIYKHYYFSHVLIKNVCKQQDMLWRKLASCSHRDTDTRKLIFFENYVYNCLTR